MSKALHPYHLTLRIWASKIERHLLRQDEAKAIAKILRTVAAGNSFDLAIGVKRTASRPKSDKTRYYVEQVHGLTQSVFIHKDKIFISGLTVAESISTVAKACSVSMSTVKTAYYSNEGRQCLEDLKAALKNPLL